MHLDFYLSMAGVDNRRCEKPIGPKGPLLVLDCTFSSRIMRTTTVAQSPRYGGTPACRSHESRMPKVRDEIPWAISRIRSS